MGNAGLQSQQTSHRCDFGAYDIMSTSVENPDQLVTSNDPDHPANLIPSLCAKFWNLGWVTGTGGGCSIRDDDLVYIAPSGVQKELMKPADIYVLSLKSQTDATLKSRTYLRSPPCYKPSQCTPLFLAAFTKRGASCCIHTHSHWAVLVTLLLAQGLRDQQHRADQRFRSRLYQDWESGVPR